MGANPLTAAALEPDGSLGEERFRVLIAGGGVAALEAVLALTELAGDRAAVELLCPAETFTLRALSVAEPFGGEEPRELSLSRFCAEHGVEHRRDALAEVWGGQRRVLTAAGEELPYDALLLAIGARQEDALPGARAFRGAIDAAWYESLLDDLERGSVRRLTFAVPRATRWSLPLLELALLTGRWLDARGVEGVKMAFVTHERAPLEVFGKEVSGHVAGLLARAGVELLAEHLPIRFEGGRVICEDGRGFDADEVVTLPALRVPTIPGLPHGRNGFIATDPEMRVEGTPGVWAAGDATWFPIKQGGIAAQQAEVAASWIAAGAGADVIPEPFQPVLRAALLTGGEPEFMRQDLGNPATPRPTALAASPLWWPPIKVAGPRLAPFLAREWSGAHDDPLGRLEDLDDPAGDPHSEEEHRSAIELALSYAGVDADEGHFEDALRWLDVAERLNVTLPAGYVERRRAWRAKVAPGAAGTSG